MSNDLISRSAVIDLIRPRFNSSKEGTLEYQRLYSILTSVQDLPTAYDVDKVVEQLHKTQVYKFQGKLPDGRICHFSDVIELVKAGGTHEDD